MDMGVDWDLLGKYFSGECSGDEEARVQAWVAEEPEREVLIEDLREVWAATDQPASEWDVEGLWGRLKEHVQEEDRRRSTPTDRRAVPRRMHTSAARRGRLPRVAAVIVAVAAIGILFVSLRWTSRGQEATVQVVVTQRGERATVRLADGTRVRLNAGSKLVYLPAFEAALRKVRLEGEAFFEVTSDAERPFVVRTEAAVVRVLGTAFDVRAYAEEGAAHVAVAEGRVAVHTSPGEERDTVVVQRGDVVTVEDRRMHVQHVEGLDRYLAWTEGRLVFEAAPFDEVARRLERVYDLQVELTVPVDSVGRLTVAFDDEPLTEIIRIVAAALRLEYRHEGREIVFNPAVTK